VPVRKPSRARLVFAKLLFATLFGGIAMLLGYALLTRIG
jgi:ABC-type transport system involved in multi-copper enzyme maturation permease subunit